MEIKLNLPENRPFRFVSGPTDQCGAKQFLDIHTHILYVGADAPTMAILGEDNKSIRAKKWHVKLILSDQQVARDWKTALKSISLQKIGFKAFRDQKYVNIASQEEFDEWCHNRPLGFPRYEETTKVYGKYEIRGKAIDVTITCGCSWLLDMTLPIEADPYDVIDNFSRYGFSRPSVSILL